MLQHLIWRTWCFGAVSFFDFTLASVCNGCFSWHATVHLFFLKNIDKKREKNENWKNERDNFFGSPRNFGSSWRHIQICLLGGSKLVDDGSHVTKVERFFLSSYIISYMLRLFWEWNVIFYLIAVIYDIAIKCCNNNMRRDCGWLRFRTAYDRLRDIMNH